MYILLLLQGKSCSFYARARYVKNQTDLEDYGITKAWDISELVEVGERVQVESGYCWPAASWCISLFLPGRHVLSTGKNSIVYS